MSSPATPLPSRPRAVDIAFWLLFVAAVLLMVGGALGATMSFDTFRAMLPESAGDDQVRNILTFHRGSGVLCVLVGVGLGFLAGRMRRGDERFRRATIVLALVTVVLVALVSAFAGIHVLALLAMLPLIGGGLLLTRPAAAKWFGAGHE